MGLNPDESVPDITLMKLKLESQRPQGHLIVWDLDKREVGFIPYDEIDKTKHIIF